MSVPDGFLAFGFSVDIVERQIYFDEFFAVFRHGVNSHGLGMDMHG